VRTDDTAATISDLTELTNEQGEEKNETTEAMDEEEDGLAPIMLNGIPKTIPTITPNMQWCKDIVNKLPKRRYGIEIKINPENPPSSGASIPDSTNVFLRQSQQQY
jgi:hypothetical protein